MLFVPLLLFLLQAARTVHSTPPEICVIEEEVSFFGMRKEGQQLNGTCKELKDPSSRGWVLPRELKFKSFKEGWSQLEDPTVYEMQIECQNLQIIPKNLIKELPKKISILTLDHNKIKWLYNEELNGINIRTLSLDGNQIELIEEDAFKGTRIELLLLRYNNLESMEFVRNLPQSIRLLFINYNKFNSIPTGVFSNLTNLEVINLGGNNITTIGKDTFNGLQSLKELFLYGNKFSQLKYDIFEGLQSLRILDLSALGLSQSDLLGFRNLTNVEIISYERKHKFDFNTCS